MGDLLETGQEMMQSSRLQSLFHTGVIIKELLVPLTYVILVTDGYNLFRSFSDR